MLETHPDYLHLAGGVSGSTAKMNIITSNGFGVEDYFKGRCRHGLYQDRNALYIQTKVGEKVILIGGGGNNGSEKLIKGFTLGTIYISEANECAESFIKECFDRTISSSLRKIFFDINPKSEMHWFYTSILDIHQANNLKYKGYGYVWCHMTIADNMSISNERMREIFRTYDKKSIWWARDILGLRKNAEGIIYDCFNADNQYSNGEGPNYDLYYKRYYTVDYGTINPFVCLEIIEQTIEGKTMYYLENIYYYDSKKHNKQKEDPEYANDLLEFIGDKRYSAIIIDPSASSFKLSLRRALLRVREADDEVVNAKNGVLNGIRLTATLLQAKVLKVNKDNCGEVLKEFATYIWNKVASERGVEEPVKAFDHCLDALRYFCSTIVKIFKR